MSDYPSILKPNSSRNDRALEKAIRKGQPDLAAVSQLLDPDRCPAELLGWLAWALSVDTWDNGWSEEAKRNIVRSAIGSHRRKGTIGAIRDALKAAGYGDAAIVEHFGWDRHEGQRRHDGSITYADPDHWAEYRIKLTRPITQEQAAQVRAMLRNVAPARCHLRALDFTEALNTHNARIAHDGQFTHGVA